MGRLKVKARMPMYKCEVCRCIPFPHNERLITRHKSGRKHQRLAQLFSNRVGLEEKFIFFEAENQTYICQICKQVLEMSMDKMQRHHRDQHVLKENALGIWGILEVSKVFHTKDFYEKIYKLEEDVENFSTVDKSVILREGEWNLVGILKTNVVPFEETHRLYNMACTLDRFGNGTIRGKKIQGTRMVMYGHFGNAQLGWFVHPKESLYDLSEMFANEMTKHFRFVFPRLMDRLDKILCNEGLSLDQGGFAKTPFTCFSITRDYECVPHDDPTDYGYRIIVWLYPNGGLLVHDFPTIWLPEYHIRFSPQNGVAFVINCNSTIHCTTKKAFVGALGMAFVMKRNFITKLKKALDEPTGETAIKYFKAKAKYEERKSAHQGCGVVEFYTRT